MGAIRRGPLLCVIGFARSRDGTSVQRGKQTAARFECGRPHGAVSASHLASSVLMMDSQSSGSRGGPSSG